MRGRWLHVQSGHFSVKGLGYRYSFICQGTSTRRQRRDLFGLRVKLWRFSEVRGVSNAYVRLLGAKTSDFRNLRCVRTDKEVKSVQTWGGGVNFSRFCADIFYVGQLFNICYSTCYLFTTQIIKITIFHVKKLCKLIKTIDSSS